MEFDPNLLSRIQFAFTVSFHIVFPSFTIGLASWLAVVEGLWLKTGNNIYQELYKFWIKIFAITFGMGVVSGVVLSYQFGTNWSGFSDKVGNVLGPILAFEVLTAFFLESSFLGIMLFGWDRVSKKMHFAATLIVAIGTIISAFWILAANSWMQTPIGYEVRADNVLYPVSWLEITFNPSFPYRFCHMIVAAYLTTSFVIGGVAAWYLIRNKFVAHAKIMFGMAMLMAVFVAPIQLFIGDQHGLNTLEHQPAKVAAMEGIWDTEKGAALRLLGWPSAQEETTKYAIEIPKMASLILTHSLDGEVKGLKEWSKEERPPVLIVFLCFRVMVGIGVLMIITGAIAVVLYLRKRLFDTKWFQYWCMLMTPTGFIAVLSGWFVTEVGRQPYIVYNLIRTSEASSPVLGQHIFASLIAFVIVYVFIFGSATYYIINLIKKGPNIITREETYGFHSLGNPIEEDNNHA
ncbi:cytochrome ubiquinol oxidase subunit I [Candidatus Tisiphia endosymbiont of Oplodontha viridula]|uniref:cytochrome ubiquinol oxidase subunit I n=1 Tax=Candidatus Tisiphia endosymbiont of Oplodontha viridula TaxID=3077925 RepID=UPI0035C912E1